MTDQRHDWQFQGAQSDRPQYKCLRCDIGTMIPKQEMRRCEPMTDQLRGERQPMQRAIEAISQGAVNAWDRERLDTTADSLPDHIKTRIEAMSDQYTDSINVAGNLEFLVNGPRFEFLQVVWNPETKTETIPDTVPDIPKEQDITKAFHPSAPTEIDTIISKAVDAIFHRGRAEQLVLLAARTLCSIRQDEPRLKFEPAYSKWLALYDEALVVLDNAVEAFEKAQEGGDRC